MDDALQQKFPDLEVGKRPSSLNSVYGFGTTLFGRRDADAETGTYVTNHCFTALFIPLFALASYRVARAEGGGWYVLGRVPTTGRAKIWNLAIVLLIFGAAGGIWWSQHTGTPEYVAGQKLKEANTAAAAGQGAQAAKLYAEVIEGHTRHEADARNRLEVLVKNPPGGTADAVEVYRVAVDLHRKNLFPTNDLFEPGFAIAKKNAEADPASALALLEIIAPFATDVEEEHALRLGLLEKLVAKDPGNVALASRLALHYEAKGEREKCKKLLGPLEASLGTQDGAAVLGRIYAAEGQANKAFALLEPFVNARLAAYQEAERTLEQRGKALHAQLIDQLRKGDAKDFDYQKYDRSTEAQQSAMVTEYLGAKFKSDAGLLNARKSLTENSTVVPAVLDLGMVRLQRAQGATDPAARKLELEKAEKTFLSIQDSAKESIQYRINLGQVYYWLNRQGEGKKQFDDLLAANGRSAEAVLLVCATLRKVGDVTEARKLAEQAYEAEKDKNNKFRIASMRSVMFKDLDDKIVWLKRSDPADLDVQASLASTSGEKALQNGDDAAAAAAFRQAIDILAKLPESAATLNNSALSHFTLAQIKQDRAEFSRGLDKLDRAIALEPSDSILLHNAASMVLENAIHDAAGAELDLKVLQSAGWDSLAYLYISPAEHKAVMARLAAHPGVVKARAYMERLMTLAPKRASSYDDLAVLFGQLRDVAGLKLVLARVSDADLDLTESIRRTKERVAKVDDAKSIDDLKKGLARAEKTLESARAVGGRTQALAASRVIQFKVLGWMLDQPTNFDSLVAMAEESYKLSPSEGSQSALQNALLLRAHTTLAAQDAGYRALAGKTRRSIGPILLYHRLCSGGPEAKAAAENADVRRLADLAREEYKLEPEAATVRMWATLVALDPEEAKRVAAHATANERARLRWKIEQKVSPVAASPAIEAYWYAKMEGKNDEAAKAFKDLAAQGLPVP